MVSAGCSSIAQSAQNPNFDAQRVLTDIAAFQAKPSERRWMPLRATLLENPNDGALGSSIVEALSQQPVPAPVMNAAAVDLANADWSGTMRWIRLYNVAARIGARPIDRQIIVSTAQLAWLMLALRANYAKDATDLSRTDLRDDARFIGQAMNFANVDFSGATLTGGTWRGANIGGARFDGVMVAGDLRCVACSLGGEHIPGTLKLVEGRWAATSSEAPR